MNAPIIETKNLGVEFWVDGQWVMAATDINFSVSPGEVLAVVGESGSGKSTSAMSLLGLLPVNGRASGSVKLAGEELIGAEKKRLRQIRGEEIAVIFQEPMTALNPVYTIGFQISEALKVHYPKMTKAEAKERALSLLAMVELPDPEKAFNSYPHQLSGGQRQRAMIAQSLSCDPKLLIADEPTTALDVTVQAEILDLLRNLNQKLQSGVILITHDMGVVADLADRILVMKDGHSVEQGTADQIFNRPQHPYTQTLLASVPKLGRSARRFFEIPKDAKPVLSMENVSIVYPKRGKVAAFTAAKNVSFEIYQGEILGLVGESGSGKTTVGRAAIGLLPVSEGSIKLIGEEIAGATQKQLRGLRQRTGVVFQDPGSSLNPRLPIGESIGEPLLLAKKAEGEKLNQIVEDLLDSVELPRNYRNRYPHELSGGQRQRVGIARAISLNPDLLIADEPTSALDVSVQARFLDLLLDLQDKLKFACLFISHDLAVVDTLAHRIAVMQHGELVEIGDRDQILNNPQNEYTRKLISAVPVPDPEEQRQRREARAKSKL
jgi:peptide/nickel transport system ATP-binding protein